MVIVGAVLLTIRMGPAPVALGVVNIPRPVHFRSTPPASEKPDRRAYLPDLVYFHQCIQV